MASFFQRLVEDTEAERAVLFEAPIIRAALAGEINRTQYRAFLEQAYHHVKHTVPLLMACGSRLSGTHRWLQRAIAEYVEEEIGHEEWILDDILACGGDPEAIRSSMPNLATESMIAYAYHQIDRGNPLGFFGMVHVLESTSVALATDAAAAIRGALDLPTTAFSYLNSHGSLDQEHVKYFEALMNRIEDPRDQEAILLCAKCFYGLYGNIFRSLPPGSKGSD
ncbi:MAG TPA: iron-containing redox enzyme family protein [Burkholderiales bacterium]|nr:iron-containing redox enzyme family protein [Burkholderiales bacterium]